MESSETRTVFFEPEFRMSANHRLMDDLEVAIDENHSELIKLRDKLSYTYWVIIILSIIMFFIGIILILVPAIAAFTNQIEVLESAVPAGFGIADLAALFIFKPLFRIHNIMGDMSQLTLALNSYQIQVRLRLIEANLNEPPTLDKAANDIDKTAMHSIKTVQEYFEKAESKNNEK